MRRPLPVADFAKVTAPLDDRSWTLYPPMVLADTDTVQWRVDEDVRRIEGSWGHGGAKATLTDLPLTYNVIDAEPFLYVSATRFLSLIEADKRPLSAPQFRQTCRPQSGKIVARVIG